jgi:demethylmenaquinone methyltransferase/2-methoxy-6-polyprenyl-1,4-benzoquinol methylase
MDHFDFIAPFYDCLAAKPDKGHFQQLLKLPCDGRLLDAGGGTARISSHLSGLIRQVVVSDLSYRMLKQASKKPVSPVGSRVEQLPFADETFDRILIVDALGMGSRFLRPEEIRGMIGANGVRARVEHPSRFTAYIIVDKK